MRSFTLFLARFCLTAWIGAAVLFVIVGVSEVVHHEIDVATRDRLVVIRFPWFYRCGFTLMGVGFAAACLTPPGPDFPPRRRTLVLGLTASALLIMAAEHQIIYLKLADLVTPPGSPRTPPFEILHRASMGINLAELLLCLSAATLVNWPATPRPGA